MDSHLLWNDRYLAAQIFQSDLRNVDTVEEVSYSVWQSISSGLPVHSDRPRRQLNDPEQRQHHGRLSCSCPAYHADLLASFHLHGEPLQNERETRPVPHGHVLKLDGTLRRPFCRRLGGGNIMRCLLGEALAAAVLHHLTDVEYMINRPAKEMTYCVPQSSCNSVS